MTFRPRMSWVAVGCATLLGLGACAGSLLQSKLPAPTVYWLSVASSGPAPGTKAVSGPLPAAVAASGVAASGVAASGVAASSSAAAPSLPPDLVILKPHVRPGLDGDRIAVLYTDRHLDYYADARWSGPLGALVQDLAVASFRAAPLGGSLGGTAVADSSAFSGSRWLEIDVTDFQAEYGAAGDLPIIHVRLVARVGDAVDRHVAASFIAEARQGPVDNRLSAIVAAFETAADAALANLVADAYALGPEGRPSGSAEGVER